jgi:hypothetical protein
MSKKLITACLALVAFAAFVIPASASAANDPDLTCSKGGALCAAGQSIDAHNVGAIVLKSSSGSVLTECSTSTFAGAVTKNDGSNVEGNIESATFSGTGTGGTCTGVFGNFTVDTEVGANGTPWCLRSTSTMAADEVQIRGDACSQFATGITFVLTGSVNCKYERKEPLIGSGTTESSGDAIVSFSAGTATEFAKEEGGVLCPSAGRLEGSWTLQKNSASTEPLFIS